MSRLREIPVAQIDEGTNVREATDEGLVASIRKHGLLQPIVVRAVGRRFVVVRAVGRRFVVVMGFRRLAAARIVGLETIPAVVEDEQRDDEILRQVAENAHRRAMNPIDIARALQAYLDAHPGMKKRELGALMGIRDGYGSVWVANKLALLKMDGRLTERIESGEVSESQAIAARQRLNDGRGRPRVIPLPEEAGRSRSVSVPFGRFAGNGGGAGAADVSIDSRRGTSTWRSRSAAAGCSSGCPATRPASSGAGSCRQATRCTLSLTPPQAQRLWA